MPLAREAFLKSILSQPTAPFREGHVIRLLEHEFQTHGVPYFKDPIGNIVVGASNKAEYLRMVRQASKEPLRIFIAHMDHPGFHGVKWLSPTEIEVKWHGGSPTALLDNAPVWLADAKGWVAEGYFKNVTMIPSGRAIDTAVVEVPATDRRTSKAEHLYGGLRFRSSFWQEGELIYTKAADDLVGVFAIASLAIDLLGHEPMPIANVDLKRAKKSGAKAKKSAAKKMSSPKKSPFPFLGLLTRAEEVGFIGAIGHFELGWLKNPKRPLLCVSLETSRTLPGADIGKGPVVRLGDRASVFDAGALKVFADLAQKTLPGRHQKRIMDGGRCEATAATVYDLPAIGISVPLGNYHNQCFEGGPDSCGPNGPAPEFVHLGDVEGLLTLCRALIEPKSPWSAPWAQDRVSFKTDLKKYRPLLESGP